VVELEDLGAVVVAAGAVVGVAMGAVVAEGAGVVPGVPVGGTTVELDWLEVEALSSAETTEPEGLGTDFPAGTNAIVIS